MSQQQLSQAYKLIKSGQKRQAEARLRDLLADDTDNADAWWLLANAATEPAAIREALERDLELRPDHKVAIKALAALNLKHPPPAPDDDYDDLFGADYGEIDASADSAAADLPDWFDDEYSDAGPAGPPPARQPRLTDEPLKKPVRKSNNQAWILWGSLGLIVLFICGGIAIVAQQATSTIGDFAQQVSDAQALAAQGGFYSEIPADRDINGLMEVGTRKTGSIVPERPDEWQFDGVAGQRILIEVFSTDDVLDPVVFLYDANFNLIAGNDDIDYGVNLDSRIRTSLPADGRYTIIIGAFDWGGRYRLELR